MSTPFSFQGTLSFPPDVNVPPELVGVAFSSQYDQFTWVTMKLTGAGTKVVDFGGIISPGAKFVLIKVDQNPTPGGIPVNLQWNGGGSPGEQEISQGGFFALGSGAPSTGLTALSIVHTTDVVVRILLLG